ncbi:MAG: hypothetical protein PHS92_01675 [Candidatus Gracilibacteria bacterium]|nr:hypothetical protein [Candidatus Gracilibacteria bacterium]
MICSLLNALPGIKELVATVNHISDDIKDKVLQFITDVNAQYELIFD